MRHFIPRPQYELKQYIPGELPDLANWVWMRVMGVQFVTNYDNTGIYIFLHAGVKFEDALFCPQNQYLAAISPGFNNAFIPGPRLFVVTTPEELEIVPGSELPPPTPTTK